MPVVKRPVGDSSESSSTGSSDAKAEESSSVYQDAMLPQDACQAGNVQMFKKRSTEPVLSAGAAPYVTGLSPSGRLLSAVNSKSRFYGAPLVAWTPSTGATNTTSSGATEQPVAGGRTDADGGHLGVLPLTPGTWYYRVRGLNPWLPKNAKLRWSGPMRVQIAKPTFSVSGG